MIICKSRDEIGKMREAGRLVAQVLSKMEDLIKPGITTEELNQFAEDLILESGATPAFKGYRGFPKSICVEINECVVHGIPDSRRLKEGDIIGIDVGVQLDGYYGDAAVTYPVGRVSAEARRLIEVTQQALLHGIEYCRVGNRLSDISHAIQSVAEGNGFLVVRNYVGHGIGREMHEDPQILNYGPPHRGPLLKEGMVFAIEPMVNTGTYEVEVLPDNWTVVTRDRRLSAHFEHTVAITDQGPLILTELS